MKSSDSDFVMVGRTIFRKGDPQTLGNAMGLLRDDLMSLCYPCRIAVATSDAGPRHFNCLGLPRQRCPECRGDMVPNASAPEAIGTRTAASNLSDFRVVTVTRRNNDGSDKATE